ncbi:AP2-like ethylene-responsive transcription factor AIL5 isoform X1 [Papaver somniferum]|uniref:AP2-like ethylene-responsive transcription factor AIL5 isoform X1 n=1 Tax=Papaver somniferum TaxID=3469 RepID=UPI000E6F75A8|nr:AP2-like ethylene-responsive transcription factor AIL5 isoform X1 [Papaver somniferum]
MDTSHQNWLGFSLSNAQYHEQTSSSPSVVPDHQQQQQFFQTLNATSFPRDENENDGSTNLSMYNFDRKLEDFLGVSSTNNTHESADNNSNKNNNSTNSSTADQYGIITYDSELKSIASSFLRGYTTDNNHYQNPSLDHHDLETTNSTGTTTAMVAAPLPVEVTSDAVSKKSVDNFGQRTSIYRGVTRHRWTGRYEAHLWDNSCRREGQSRKGRQVYLGGYDKEDKAARAYDLAALKYWGPTTSTNFPVTNYEKEIEDMTNMTRQEFVASLRRKSSGFSRGASIYRGVTRHHQHGRWQARIGRVAGNKDLYLGTFSTQEEAAEAYDIAAIKFRGLNAVTNFDMSRYDVKSIANSNLPIGGITGSSSKTTKAIINSDSISDDRSNDGGHSDDRDFSSTTLSFGLPIKQDPSSTDYWSLVNGSGQNNGVTNILHQQTSSHDQGNITTGNMFFNGGFVHQLQQQEQQCVMSSSSPMSYDGSAAGYGGEWVLAQPPLVYQTGKPNLSVFQTPIYGME